MGMQTDSLCRERQAECTVEKRDARCPGSGSTRTPLKRHGQATRRDLPPTRPPPARPHNPPHPKPESETQPVTEPEPESETEPEPESETEPETVTVSYNPWRCGFPRKRRERGAGWDSLGSRSARSCREPQCHHDLRHHDLCHHDLSHHDLCHHNLSHHHRDLCHHNLPHRDLRHHDLRHHDLSRDPVLCQLASPARGPPGLSSCDDRDVPAPAPPRPRSRRVALGRPSGG